MQVIAIQYPDKPASQLYDLTRLSQATAAQRRARENQRLSRSRRKQYLQELETRYRICELLGAKASVEMQSAARRVAEENESLRTLLRAKGVDNEEIDTHLLNSIASASFPSATQMLVGSRPCFRQRDQPSGVSIVSGECTASPVDFRRTGLEDQGTSTSRISPLLPSHLLEEQIPEQDILANNSMPGSPSSTQLVIDERGQQLMSTEQLWKEHAAPGTTTSCNLAITIIIGANSDISESQARLDLGCGMLADCIVENSTLLELLDKYSAKSVYPSSA